MEIVKNIFDTCTNIILPPICLSCERPVQDTGLLCSICWSHVTHLEHPLCPIMGTPLAHANEEGLTSIAGLTRTTTFDRACSVVLYEGVTQQIVQLLKFADRTDLAPWIAKWMVNFAKRTIPELLDDDLIVMPVPLHRKRLLSRRYNQSAELSRAFCAETKQLYRPDILYRSRHTHSQLGLSRHLRLKNLKGAFKIHVDKRSDVKNARVLLIDDVFTTGSTMDACSQALRRAGAAHIICFTLARVA